MITYAVIIERADDGGYGAWCPDLPGCVALGDTEAEAIAEMRQAMELHLAGMRENGIEIRAPARSPSRPSPRVRPEPKDDAPQFTAETSKRSCLVSFLSLVRGRA